MKITFSDLTIAEAQKLLAYATAMEVGLTGPTAEELAKNAGLLSEDEPLQKPRRRRRSKAEMEEARADDAVTEAQKTDTRTEPAPAPEPDSAPRRRRSATPDEGPASQGEDDTPEPRRRRRRSASEDSPTIAPPVRRRKRHLASDTAPTADPGPTGDEITDRDVAKAASEGAQELTPTAVRGILDPFGVSNVADLDQGQRRKFIDLIDDAIESAQVVAHGKDD